MAECLGNRDKAISVMGHIVDPPATITVVEWTQVHADFQYVGQFDGQQHSVCIAEIVQVMSQLENWVTRRSQEFTKTVYELFHVYPNDLTHKPPSAR